MSFRINQVPNNALGILQNSLKPVLGFSPWPGNVWIIQDSEVTHYQQCLQLLNFDYNFDPVEEKEKVAWQILQTYRILNAAISSKHRSMKPFKEALRDLRLELESDPEFSAYLRNKNPGDIICSGHGVWYESEGYVNLSSSKTEVKFYAIEGASISANLSIDIENQNLISENIAVSHDISGEISLLPSNDEYPYRYNQSGNNVLPNYILAADDRHKARIIEDGTGRILYETNSYISLKRIIDKFPDRTIHWAPCVAMFNSENKPIGAYSNCTWVKISYIEKINMKPSIFNNTHVHFGREKTKPPADKNARFDLAENNLRSACNNS